MSFVIRVFQVFNNKNEKKTNSIMFFSYISKNIVKIKKTICLINVKLNLTSLG